MNIDTEKVVEQLGKGLATLQAWLQEWMSEKEAYAYSEGVNLGVGKTISALYEANVDDDTIITLLNKHWGICWDEAEHRLEFEKKEALLRTIRQHLRREGLSDQAVRHFLSSNKVIIKVKEHPELRKLKSNPAQLIEEIQKL